MTDLLIWLPFGVVGVVLMRLLVTVAWPYEIDTPTPDRSSPCRGVGRLRVAAVGRTRDGVVLDGLVDRLSALGSVGTPVSLLLDAERVEEAAYEVLERWVAADAVVEVGIPGSDLAREVELRSGDDSVRMPILGLTTT